MAGCSCLCKLIRKLTTLLAITGILFVVVFIGYTYHIKQRMPTLNEFKDFSQETYSLAEKQSVVYYSQFKKDHLPCIEKYTKPVTDKLCEFYTSVSATLGKNQKSDSADPSTGKEL